MNVDISEVFEWADSKLKAHGITYELSAAQYIYLLGGCWRIMRTYIHHVVDPTFTFRIRSELLRYLTLERNKGAHSFKNCDELLETLVFPVLSFDVGNERKTFFELEEKHEPPIRQNIEHDVSVKEFEAILGTLRYIPSNKRPEVGAAVNKIKAVLFPSTD